MSAALRIEDGDPLLAEVAAQGFARVPGVALEARLGLRPEALADFARSWERLETDRFMADGGRYRRRRHANFSARAGVPGHVRGPHRASRRRRASTMTASTRC